MRLKPKYFIYSLFSVFLIISVCFINGLSKPMVIIGSFFAGAIFDAVIQNILFDNFLSELMGDLSKALRDAMAEEEVNT